MNKFIKVLKKANENKREKISKKNKETELVTDWLNDPKKNYNSTVVKTEDQK